MPNVKFKKGLSATLLALNSYEEGCFYLTTDTDKLYVAQSNNSIVELNRYIDLVDEVSDLPRENVKLGQFVYIKGTNQHYDSANDGYTGTNGNILAVCVAEASGANPPSWVQVNPDTDTNDYLTDVSIVKGNYDSTNKVVPYTFTFQIAHKTGQSTSFAKTLNIALADIISKADIDVSTSSSGNTVTVTAKVKDIENNTLSTGDSFSITGGNNVTVSESNGNITIASGIGADSVQMAVSGATANQVSAAVNVNNVASGDTLKIAGDTSKDIGIVWDSTNGIAKIGHSNTATAASQGADIELDGTTNNNFDVVTGVTYDSYGHISALTTQNVELPGYQIDYSVDTTNNNQLNIRLLDQDNNLISSFCNSTALFNTITVYDSANPNATASASTIYNQGNLGTFYSKSAIDNMLKGLDALSYKGTVGSAGSTAGTSLPSSGVHAGDTYKADVDMVIDGENIAAGDLLIATGTEDPSTGVIGNDLAWSHVSTGADTDTTYTLSVGGTNNAAQATMNSSTSTSDSVIFTGDGTVAVAPTAGTKTIAFSHAASGASAGSYGPSTSTISEGGNFVVPNITVDAKGHITSVANSTITIPDSTLVWGSF